MALIAAMMLVAGFIAPTSASATGSSDSGASTQGPAITSTEFVRTSTSNLVGDDLPEGIDVTERADGTLDVRVDGESFIVKVEADVAHITLPDGTQAHLPLDGVASPSLGSGDTDVPTITPRGSLTCSIIMYAVQALHAYGWGAAIAAVVATGGTGAALIPIMYALGSEGFLIWAGSRC